MKRTYIYLAVILLVAMFVTSCELIDDLGPNADGVSRLEGQWKCDENSQNYKKSTMGIYYVYISPHPGDTTRVLISNFYQLGDHVEASAKLSGQTLILDSQNLPGDFRIVSGSGSISSNFKTINWSYKVDDGSGDLDNATATYTLVY
ncbi:MAG: hypothetical protein JW723_15135 [Bacteroidales bacterium]|nr:hypothetical protein [Bacteroidales bacterium]